MKIWKRNAVVAAIVLFVCAAVYLNWSYSQDGSNVTVDALPTGKLLGGAAEVSATGAAENEASQSPTSSAQPSGAAEEPGQTTANDYFSSARINRQQARDSALSLLEEAAANNDAEQTIRDQANASIQVMADCTMAEAQIENLVIAKGYANCVAFVGEDSASVVVSLDEGQLTETDTAKIMEITMEQTGLEAGQIKVIQAE